jgi:hypothetical protein
VADPRVINQAVVEARHAKARAKEMRLLAEHERSRADQARKFAWASLKRLAELRERAEATRRRRNSGRPHHS